MDWPERGQRQRPQPINLSSTTIPKLEANTHSECLPRLRITFKTIYSRPSRHSFESGTPESPLNVACLATLRLGAGLARKESCPLSSICYCRDAAPQLQLIATQNTARSAADGPSAVISSLVNGQKPLFTPGYVILSNPPYVVRIWAIACSNVRVAALDIDMGILFRISCLGKTMLKIRRGEIIFDQFRWSNG